MIKPAHTPLSVLITTRAIHLARFRCDRSDAYYCDTDSVCGPDEPGWSEGEFRTWKAVRRQIKVANPDD